ncbi:MAG TPA: hypothetical protein PLW44_07060 [Chitinophagales bacterium]|nr:hypothetical protein [Chitinophagales bacterium]
MKKLYWLTITVLLLTGSCTRCYYCTESGTGTNGAKVCDGNPDYAAAKEAAKSGNGYTDSLSMTFYKCK